MNIIGFLFGMICLIPFSYGHQKDPETLKEVSEQLQATGYSAGENKFSSIAYGVTDSDVDVIKKVMDSNGVLHNSNGVLQKDGDAQHNEKTVFLSAYLSDKKVVCCGLYTSKGDWEVIKLASNGCNLEHELYPDFCNASTKSETTKNNRKFHLDFYNIITKISENLNEYASSKYMEIDFSFFQVDSKFKKALSWHRDHWHDDESNPDLLAFSVLDMTLPDKRKETSYAQLMLGLIDQKYERHYGFPQLEGEGMGTPNYEPMIRKIGFPGYVNVVDDKDNCVRYLKELNDFTGSGYIIDQAKTGDNDTKIVHARSHREYEGVRLSMVARCSKVDSEDDMMKKPLYCKIKSSKGIDICPSRIKKRKL
ncbi:MAG: hypothetical protein QS721_15590 [Candidatus Endonucleobacter sp. (ex Gigantidas childressi)]|nr:hypothetical protein [Candidatus Endonucleobacter sp. (ex Gigantidas childressi)]